jgi:hypothetical protein
VTRPEEQLRGQQFVALDLLCIEYNRAGKWSRFARFGRDYFDGADRPPLAPNSDPYWVQQYSRKDMPGAKVRPSWRDGPRGEEADFSACRRCGHQPWPVPRAWITAALAAIDPPDDGGWRVKEGVV